MADISRDSFLETKNSLVDLRGLLPAPQSTPKHYVSIHLQQGVPLLDSDWNEQGDIRRLELETILAAGIGNGVPSGSDGFRISETLDNNNFLITIGYLFCDGWLVINPQDISYVNQPHRGADGVDPALPASIGNAPISRKELVYLDAWEAEVSFEMDELLVDPNIGIETCIRLERVWVIRMIIIADDADPLDPATITDHITGHRYYPLAVVDRPTGGEIKDHMITDLRRTHLTLAAVTHQPLFVYDPIRDQTLDAQRLADALSANLVALDEVFRATPDAFVFPIETVITWSVMTLYNDLRALAIAIREQAIEATLPRDAALDAMVRFYNAQRVFSEELQPLLLAPPDGISAGESTQNFLDSYNRFLFTDPLSLEVAIDASDVLGTVLAQERINHEISILGGARLDGTVGLSLIGQSPAGVVVAGVNYAVTVHITSLLISEQGEEEVRVIAEAGAGWSLSFQGTSEPAANEILITVPNQTTQDIVLDILASNGAAPTALELKVFPERRKLRVFRLPDVPLVIGSEIVAGATAVAALSYQGPPLNPGNIAPVNRTNMFNTGIPLSFRIENLSSETQNFILEITAEGTPSDWNDTPDRLPMAPLNGGQIANAPITFKTSDELGASSPQAFTVQLLQVNADTSETPLTYTAFTLTFELT